MIKTISLKFTFSIIFLITLFSFRFSLAETVAAQEPCPSTYPYCECTAPTLRECFEAALQNGETGMNWCQSGYAELNIKIITILEKNQILKNSSKEKIIKLREKLFNLQKEFEEKEPGLNYELFTKQDISKSPYFLKWYIIKILNTYITNEILKDYPHCS